MLDWIFSWWGSEDTSPFLHPGIVSRKVIEQSTQDHDDGEESLDVWGFHDTRFQTDEDGIVEVTGSRYPLSGQKLPSLLPVGRIDKGSYFLLGLIYELRHCLITKYRKSY